MLPIIPQKLKNGDSVAVIAPACSLGMISQDVREVANRRFEEMGLKIIFGKHVEETDEFNSSSIASRIEDLHDAFGNNEVKGIFCVIGGHNSNQLLKYIDWALIKNNPKIFCGYSDIAALGNAIFAKTGLVTYSAPVYSTFGQKLYFGYTMEYVKKCLFESEPFAVKPSKEWTDDKWYISQNERRPIANTGYRIINNGHAEGTILATNLCTFNLLHGTEYMPSLKNSLLFIEDDEETHPKLFDRDLQSVMHQPCFDEVKGIVIGRFQQKSDLNNDNLVKIIKSKRELDKLPIIANADFGHTSPIFSFPIGGEAKISAGNGVANIEIVKH